ncbi:exopolysaccharide biosynthesis polyprenyl glycosylphosphotransferase [Litchfieldella qijiaojingensis]|uniref:exopolysaccharide biosynthesis polyprenyl glycosylphosphotransferase n=1 Tax=Litchfieldella qijiaojingensis TaxID=980347 RepID=UPI001E48F4C4|nr:exopolysaccharide biosynthesis polyprenyl glycosylphosphotransferase [Halomonas qijiaojingensis]
MEHQRRHASIHERLLYSTRVQRLIGMVIAVLLPAAWLWGWGFWQHITVTQWNSLLGTATAYLLAVTAVQRLAKLPGTRAYLLIVPSITLCYCLLLIVLYLLTIEHAQQHILVSYGSAVVYCTTGYAISTRFSRLKLAVVPFGKTVDLCHGQDVDWCYLDAPALSQECVDGVVADLRAELPESWERFLSDCTLHRIPVYHVTNAFEFLTGRVLLNHLCESCHGTLQPDEGYEIIKRGLDLLVVLLLMPFVLPMMAVTALAIRLDSPGPALFTQQRMGFHCRPFTVYKFRSMYIDHEGTGFTQNGHDPRITLVGRVIRKYRIDELPQLLNVLKGDMSLIGPRPESLELTDWYQQDVPFFHYRHVVRPGISGWAQVEQGYAAEVDGMVRKLEYDFYYIKHFSLWLDLLIVIRTIKILFTGRGSR